MTVTEVTEVPTSWTRDYRADKTRRARAPGASVDLGIIRSRAVSVGIDANVYPFPQVQALLDRANAWDLLAWESCGQAQLVVAAAKERALAVTPPTIEALNAYVAEKERLRPWSEYEPMNVDAGEPGQERRVILAANELAKEERAKAGGLLNGAAAELYSMFARQAARAVAQVAELLPLPRRVWSSLEPTAVLAAEPQSVLWESERVFQVCHYVGTYLRAIGPDPVDQFRADEPHLAVCFRKWSEAHAHHHELGSVRKPLKLAYAIEHGWEPGMWTYDDLQGVDQGPARKKYVPAFMVR